VQFIKKKRPVFTFNMGNIFAQDISEKIGTVIAYEGSSFEETNPSELQHQR
jgi:hypothetical protein